MVARVGVGLEKWMNYFFLIFNKLLKKQNKTLGKFLLPIFIPLMAYTYHLSCLLRIKYQTVIIMKSHNEVKTTLIKNIITLWLFNQGLKNLFPNIAERGEKISKCYVLLRYPPTYFNFPFLL